MWAMQVTFFSESFSVGVMQFSTKHQLTRDHRTGHMDQSFQALF